MYIPSIPLEIDDNPQIVMIIMAGTVLIVLVAVSIYLVKTRQVKLNWYDDNILDMGQAPQHVRCKAFNRTDTEDDNRSVDGRQFHSKVVRKQSRIMPVSAGLTAAPPSGDFFTIPRMNKNSRSMFTNINHKEFDRGLYQCQAPDESVCSEEMGAAGSMQLSLSLDANLGILTVLLKQAIDLPSKRQDDSPNPYFRVALDVPEGQKMEYQTKTYKETACPTIDEEYCFQIPAAQIASCRLEIMVYDYDQFSVDECVGYCWLTLGRLSVSLRKDNPTVFWAEVLPYDENGGKGFGEILFSLSYLSHAQRLTMNVFKARNLSCRPETNGAVSMRVTLVGTNEKKLKRKKTSSKRNVRNLQFNESLTFNVPKHSLCDIVLEVEAMHETGTFGMTTESVGRMTLPLHRCKDLWRAIIREEKSQARWYSLEEP
ncbi:unnamed protein product [Auanema sp. JU1783]|nr:unnamed protein product [Auanema sp. JU1783]